APGGRPRRSNRRRAGRMDRRPWRFRCEDLRLRGETRAGRTPCRAVLCRASRWPANRPGLIAGRGGQDAGELLGDAALDLLGEGGEQEAEVHVDVHVRLTDGDQRVEALARDLEEVVALPGAGGAIVAGQLLGGAAEALLGLLDGELVRDVDLV